MKHGEEKANPYEPPQTETGEKEFRACPKPQRWRFSIRSLFVLSTIISVVFAVGSFLDRVQPQLPRLLEQFIVLLAYLIIAGSIGGFVGKTWRGTRKAYWSGFVIFGILGPAILLGAAYLIVEYYYDGRPPF